MKHKLFFSTITMFTMILAYATIPHAAEIVFNDEFDSYSTEENMVNAGWSIDMYNYSEPRWDINFDTPGQLTITHMYHGTENYAAAQPDRTLALMYYYLPAPVDGDFTLTMKGGWNMSSLTQTLTHGLSAQGWEYTFAAAYDPLTTQNGEYLLRVYDENQDIVETLISPQNSLPYTSEPETVYTISRQNGLISSTISANGSEIYSILDVPNSMAIDHFWMAFAVFNENSPDSMFVDSVTFTGDSSTYIPVPEPLSVILLISSVCALIKRYL